MRSDKKFLNFRRLAAVVVGIALLPAAQAHATLMLNVYEGSTPVGAVTDNGAGDTSPSTGLISYSLTGNADFTLSIAIATSNAGAPNSIDQLKITSFDVRNTSGAQKNLTLVLSDTGFSGLGASPDLATLSSTLSSTFTTAAVGDSVNFLSLVDPSNAQQTAVTPNAGAIKDSPTGQTQVALGNPLDSFGSITTSNTFALPPSGLFSMANISSFNLSAGASLQTSGASIATAGAIAPEPASFALLTMAGLTFVGSRRRRV